MGKQFLVERNKQIMKQKKKITLQKRKFVITSWKGWSSFQGSVKSKTPEPGRNTLMLVQVYWCNRYVCIHSQFHLNDFQRAVEIKVKRFLGKKEFTLKTCIKTDYILPRPLGNLFNQLNQVQEADQKRS